MVFIANRSVYRVILPEVTYSIIKVVILIIVVIDNI